MKKILLYGMDDYIADQYQNIATECGIAMFVVGDDVLDVTVENAFQFNEDMDTKHEEFEESFLVMQELEEKDILELLEAFEKSGCPYKGIKVVKTPTNASWTLRNLFLETMQERNVLRKAWELDQLLKDANDVDFSKMDEADSKVLKEAFMDSYLLLKSGNYDEHSLTKAIEELIPLLQKSQKIVH